MHVRLEKFGVQVLFVALVLALSAGIGWLPVYSPGGMRILLGYIYDANGPLGFVLDRLLPAAAVSGVLGVSLLEIGRGRVVREGGRLLNRERIVLGVAIVGEGAILGSLAFLASADVNAPLMWAAIGALVTVAVGCYLFWTAESRMGPRAKPILLVALGTAFLSAGLSVLVRSLEPPSPVWYDASALDVSRWLLGELSVGLWVLAYAGILLTKPAMASPVVATPQGGG